MLTTSPDSSPRFAGLPQRGSWNWFRRFRLNRHKKWIVRQHDFHHDYLVPVICCLSLIYQYLCPPVILVQVWLSYPPLWVYRTLLPYLDQQWDSESVLQLARRHTRVHLAPAGVLLAAERKRSVTQSLCACNLIELYHLRINISKKIHLEIRFYIHLQLVVLKRLPSAYHSTCGHWPLLSISCEGDLPTPNKCIDASWENAKQSHPTVTAFFVARSPFHAIHNCGRLLVG